MLSVLWLLQFTFYSCLAQTCPDSSIVGCRGEETPQLDGQQARGAFTVAMNFQGHKNETAILNAWVAAVLAQVPPSTAVTSKIALLRYLSDLMMDEVIALTNDTSADVVAKARDLNFQCERIRQNTPMNVVDGMWANMFVPGAVPKPYTLIVDKIRFEEQGEGDLNKNHPYMWMRTAASVGYTFPPVESSDFAQRADFDDKAFWNAALSASVGRLPNWIPETLGMIAFLEMRSSAPCHKQIQHMKWHGLDFSYYQVHRSIDNPNDGHGAKILQAIDMYVSEAGSLEEEMDWVQRIYQGYHAFEFTIDAIDEAVEQRLPTGGCPEAGSIVADAQSLDHDKEQSSGAGQSNTERVIAITQGMERFIERHAFAYVFHKGVKKDIMRHPSRMVQYLRERCDLFLPGDIEATQFLRLFQHGGPMYGVGASDSDVALLRSFASLSQELCIKLNR
mmetsp:Transcript_134858/g.336509  ORF Transcript_134858/g.336509 Transcript_134858/m.336509 type:complete len:448 (+) Transcript_134858:41-1384(+)